MAASKQEITLSKSSIATFDECQRRWALQYQRYKLPHALKREAIYQHRLMGMFALTGQLVDDLITSSLRLFKRKQKWPSSLETGAVKLLDQYLEETRRWIEQRSLFIEDPERGRRQPIDEFYWNGLPEIDAKRQIVEEVVSLAQAWFDSEIPTLILERPIVHWKVPESGGDLPTFELDGIKVYAKYDFALHSDTETLIFDWKTGKVGTKSEADVAEQLHTYAKYAFEAWGTKPENLRLFAVWLSIGSANCLHEVPYTPDLLANLEDLWRDKHRVLTSKLQMAGNNPMGILDQFPMTSSVYRCASCRFRVCEGYARAESARAEKVQE